MRYNSSTTAVQQQYSGPILIAIIILSATTLHSQNWWDSYIPKTADESLFYLSKREYRVDPKLESNVCPWQSIRLLSNQWTSIQIDVLVKKEDFHAFSRSELEEDLHDFYEGKGKDHMNMVQRGFPCNFKTTGQRLPIWAYYEKMNDPVKGDLRSSYIGPIPAMTGTYRDWSWKVMENKSVMASRDEGEYWHYSISQWLWAQPRGVYNQ